jgi:hypothetical protein
MITTPRRLKTTTIFNKMCSLGLSKPNRVIDHNSQHSTATTTITSTSTRIVISID